MQRPEMSDLTPREIVAELDRFIIGQAAAKRAVAVALRNRWRRRQLPPELAEEVHPKNSKVLNLIRNSDMGRLILNKRGDLERCFVGNFECLREFL